MADTPYTISGALAGRGGRQRRQKIDDLVDQAVGNSSASATPDTSVGLSTVATKKKKAPYVPTAEERRTRTYGSPINEPLVKQ